MSNWRTPHVEAERELITSFECPECLERPGKPCRKMWPRNARPISFAYWPKSDSKIYHMFVYYDRDAGTSYGEQYRAAVREVKRRGGELVHMDEDTRLGDNYEEIGKPTKRLHGSRSVALAEWRAYNDRLAMQDYLGSWLTVHGNIFEESRANADAH